MVAQSHASFLCVSVQLLQGAGIALFQERKGNYVYLSVLGGYQFVHLEFSTFRKVDRGGTRISCMQQTYICFKALHPVKH